MNCVKALIAGVVGGIVVNLYDFLMHGFVMASTYEKYPIFDVEPANPVWFFVVAILVGTFAAFLFARTRESWPAGVKGGALFGFSLGLVVYFMDFYNPLVLAGFPYHLAWCWGGINLIGWVIFGVVAGAIYKGKPAS